MAGSHLPVHQVRKDVCSHLISALKDATTFEVAKHTQSMAAANAAIRTSEDSLHEVKRTTDPIPAANNRTQFRDALRPRYCITSPNLPTHCNGCGAKFSRVQEKRISHPTPCRNQSEFQDLAARVLISTVVRDEPQKSIQLVVQMLKRLEECLHQQQNEVVYF